MRIHITAIAAILGLIGAATPVHAEPTIMVGSAPLGMVIAQQGNHALTKIHQSLVLSISQTVRQQINTPLLSDTGKGRKALRTDGDLAMNLALN